MRIPLALVAVAAAPLLMADTCSPASGLQPAYTPATVVADDALVGAWAILNDDGKARGRASFVKEPTADGLSYILTIEAPDKIVENKKVRFRVFRFDVAGMHMLDAVVLPNGNPEAFAATFPLPQHVYGRVVLSDEDTTRLEVLDASWAEKHLPAGLALVDVPQRYFPGTDGALRVDRARVLTADAAALTPLFTAAAQVPEAWGLSFELLREGARRLDFHLVVSSGERSRDASSHESTFTVKGAHLVFAEESSGRDALGPDGKGKKGSAHVPDKLALGRLLDAAEKAPPTRPAKPVPHVETRYVELCLTVRGGKPRCVERLPDDDSGADFKAFMALYSALVPLIPTAP